MTTATTTRRIVAGNKYGAKRTWSASCERWFDSKAEAARAEELVLLERAGEIRELEFQPSWVLCDRPRVTYTADFIYKDLREYEHGEIACHYWRPDTVPFRTARPW